MNALVTLFTPFLRIVAHRAGPENLPASQFLLALVLIAHIAVNIFVMFALLDATGVRLIAVPLVDTAAQGLVFALLVIAMGLPQRLLQTLTAVFGADVVLNLLSLPLNLVSQPDPQSLSALLLGIVVIVFLLWSMGVKGHILKRAVGLPYFVGFAIGLGLALSVVAFDATLFGV